VFVADFAAVHDGARVVGERGREPLLERGGVRASRNRQQGQLHDQLLLPLDW
jgi:hypothetical protein